MNALVFPSIRPLAFSLAAGLSVASCSATPASSGAKLPVSGSSPVELLSPLPDGARFTYRVTSSGDGRSRTVEIDAHQNPDGSVDLESGARKETLRVAGSGVTTLDGRTLLRPPLEAGSSWDAGRGRKARLDAVNLDVVVPAGTYTGCVRVISEDPPPKASRVTSTYCPNIGRVVFETDDGATVGKRHVARFELVSVGRAPGRAP